jgi:hypothetical protein
MKTMCSSCSIESDENDVFVLFDRGKENNSEYNYVAYVTIIMNSVHDNRLVRVIDECRVCHTCPVCAVVQCPRWSFDIDTLHSFVSLISNERFHCHEVQSDEHQCKWSSRVLIVFVTIETIITVIERNPWARQHEQVQRFLFDDNVE